MPGLTAEDSIAAVLDLLNGVRRQVVADLASNPAPLATSASTLTQNLSGYLATFQRQATAILAAAEQQISAEAEAAVLADVASFGLDLPLLYLPPDPAVLGATVDYGAQLIADLANLAQARIGGAIRQFALGAAMAGAHTPGGLSSLTTSGVTSLAPTFGPDLGLPDKLGTAETPGSVFTSLATNATVLVGTELSRVKNVTTQLAGEQVHKANEGLKKAWVHSSQTEHEGARANHIALAEREPIPFGERFDLGGGVTAAHPHEWSLPVGEVANCRCELKLIKPDGSEAEGGGEE